MEKFTKIGKISDFDPFTLEGYQVTHNETRGKLMVFLLIQSSNCTQITFIYQPAKCSSTGGWINIPNMNAIRTNGAIEKKYRRTEDLQNVDVKVYFNNNEEYFVYNIFYSPLNLINCDLIEISESENITENRFDFIYNYSGTKNRNMEILTSKAKIKEGDEIIYSPMVTNQPKSNPEILRISNEDNLTRIDFIYYPKQNGSWVQIDKNTFIRPVGSKTQLRLVKVENIPLVSTEHWFKRPKEILCYSLYFPSLPIGTSQIDIIECERAGGCWFNFFGVSIEKVRSEKLIIEN